MKSGLKIAVIFVLVTVISNITVEDVFAADRSPVSLRTFSWTNSDEDTYVDKRTAFPNVINSGDTGNNPESIQKPRLSNTRSTGRTIGSPFSGRTTEIAPSDNTTEIPPGGNTTEIPPSITPPVITPSVPPSETPYLPNSVINSPLPSDIQVQRISVNPSRIAVGQTAEVKVKVVNLGGQSGEYNVVLKLDGKIQKSQMVRLDAGQSTEVAVILSPGRNGMYTLTADSAYADLVVDPRTTPDVVETNYWWLLYIAMGVSILIFSFGRIKPSSEKESSNNN